MPIITRPTDKAQCSGLDPAWDKITTEVAFPVETGTKLTVSCEEGFLLKGTNTVTCTEGTTFSSDTTPQCIKQGKRTIHNMSLIKYRILWYLGEIMCGR